MFEIVILVVLIFLSAYFSATETAFFSLSPLRLKKLANEGDTRAADVLAVLSDKQRVLISLLLGNCIVNVTATALVTSLVLDYVTHSDWLSKSVLGNSSQVGVAIASFFMTILILFFGEIIPKTIAIFYSVRFAQRAVGPLRLFLLLFSPLTTATIWVLQHISPAYSDWNQKLGSRTSMEEIDSYFSLGEEVGIIESDEKEMISSVFEFGDTLVREVMVSRMDIMSVSLDIHFESLLKFVREDGHSRFPVYDGNLDKVVGILYVKDILLGFENLEANFDLPKLLRPAFFVPETKKLNEMLKEFQKRKIHMALVVDEFGGISGLVTLEDLLEEIVGEIVDEYDQDEVPPIMPIDQNSFMVDARVRVNDLENELGLTLPHEDAETVSGFILEKLGRIPKRDERLEEEKAVFVVLEMKGNRILRVKVTKNPPPEPEIKKNEDS